jgi:hypothetical protein
VARFPARPWAHRALGSLGLLCALLLVLTSAAGASAFKAVVSSNGSFSTSTLQLEGTTAGPDNCYSTGSGAGGSVTASKHASVYARLADTDRPALQHCLVECHHDLDIGRQAERDFLDGELLFVRGGGARRF